MDAIRFQGDETVLDVACGTGELERRLLDRWPGLRILGADLSFGMLDQAVSKEHRHRVGWLQAESIRLPFPEESFDCCICANSFHYFRSPHACLAEIRRVLRPAGTLILVDWCDDYLSCKLCSFWLRFTQRAFYRMYSRQSCHRLIERAGFRVQRFERFRINWLWGLMRFVCQPACVTESCLTDDRGLPA